jgi:hypothetical protein
MLRTIGPLPPAPGPGLAPPATGALDAARWRSAFTQAAAEALPALAEPAWPAALADLPFECQLLNGPLAGARLQLRVEPGAGGVPQPRLVLQLSPASLGAWRARGVDLAAVLAAAGPVVVEACAGDTP